MKTFSVMLVDDEILTLNNLKKALEKEGYEIILAESGEKALDLLESCRPQLILLDLVLPGISGLEVLKKVKETDREIIVIMMSAYEILEKAVEAMKLGAYDYLLKPFKLSELKATVQRALETLSLRLRFLDEFEKQKQRYYFGKIVAQSRKMREVLDMAARVAQSDRTTVLLQGESGTGKELLARAIHYHSPRAEKPIVAINCAAIPENLLESELFGYEAGAFTDARKRKIGLLEKADEGTVFFDEIGDMSLALQAKILRVLEDGTFVRLGGSQPIKINVRIIAATNRDLVKETEKGNFRSDLFYRLNVVPITIPPLRERKEDIIPLILFFMEEFNREIKRNYRGLEPEAAQALMNYSWPGNVRELRNTVERVMSLYQAENIQLQFLPQEIRQELNLPEDKVLEALTKNWPTLDHLEKAYIARVLEYTGHNKSQAARILGLNPATLYRKIKSWKE
ncbi:MAG: Sigma-54-dependent transcriptional activator [Candidatus Saccharicenans subterraneus]|uniref:Sigma-54-dependent transcriptional activator n=1 Tax=Candidatus Saccharicenans subterraneus TaxID=2508984 RepID=A0A3E2BPC8_9BACT|nr:MAG: Sigma-54-dependent transcriptional activator [Candidatus Saccharicenans subterraneum]